MLLLQPAARSPALSHRRLNALSETSPASSCIRFGFRLCPVNHFVLHHLCCVIFAAPFVPRQIKTAAMRRKNPPSAAKFF
jgi:hypothetical protein